MQGRVDIEPREQAAATAPADWRRWYMLAVLTLFVIVSYIDRTVLSLLIVPIKADLQLSDTQASLLLGLSFALFYGFVSIPAGYLVDRYPRLHLLFGAVLLWTTMTLFSGLSVSFLLLLLCRTGVGMGEAVLSPGAYSIIADSFDGRERARAFSTFSLGNAIGGGVALALVGALLGWLNHAPFAGVPLLGGMQPWQLVLLLIGAAGIPLAFLLLTCREPARAGKPGEQQVTFAAAFAHGRSDGATYALLYGANLMIGIGMFGSSAWIPTMIERLWSVPLAEIGKTYGGIQIVASLCGLLGTGVVLDWLTRRGRHVGVAVAGGLALATGGLALVLAPLAGSLDATWAALALMLLLVPCAPVVTAVILTRLTPGRMVGKFSAFTFLVVSAAGTAIGPTLIALLSDGLFGGGRGIGIGVSLGGGLALVVSGLLFLVLALRLRRHPEFA